MPLSITASEVHFRVTPQLRLKYSSAALYSYNKDNNTVRPASKTKVNSVVKQTKLITLAKACLSIDHVDRVGVSMHMWSASEVSSP